MKEESKPLDWAQNIVIREEVFWSALHYINLCSEVQDFHIRQVPFQSCLEVFGRTSAIGIQDTG